MGYSILIRTLGKAGDKYAKMLKCIDKLQLRPEEVIIAIPYGYELPKERLGYERFVRTRKGMVWQRCEGVLEIKSEYVLFLDDDLSFAPDFVEKLSSPVNKGEADAAFAPLYELLPQGKSIVNSCLAGSAIPMIFETDQYFLKILKTGGYSYNKKVLKSEKKYFYAQTGPGACIYISLKTFLEVEFEQEVWLEKYGYAMGEDQVFFYKMYLKGYKIVCVADAKLKHLDASTSINGNFEKAAFSSGWFKTIFWKRFIYDTERKNTEKIKSKVAFLYCFYINVLSNLIKAKINSRRKKTLVALLQGRDAAYKFISSDEYHKMKPIRKEIEK